MWKKLRDFIMDTSYDERFDDLKESAVLTFLLALSSFFLIKKFIPKLLIINYCVFAYALIVGILTVTIKYGRQFIPYREMYLKEFYKEHPELRDDIDSEIVEKSSKKHEKK